MPQNLNRQYRFTAHGGGQEFTVGEPNERGYAVHIKFEIERTDSETLNTSQISLWNLNADEISTLMTTGCVVAIEAGYGDNLNAIFTGTVSQVKVEMDKADIKVTLDVVDGLTTVDSTYVSVSIGDDIVYGDELVQMVADQMSLPVVYGENCEKNLKMSGARCYSFEGLASDALDDILYRLFKASTGADRVWYIENGVLIVRYEDESPSTGLVHLISPATGLIGLPGRIYNSSVSSDEGDTVTDELYGYELEFFMNGAINVGDKVQVESKTVSGTFLVYKLTIEGDNCEGDWVCKADVTECEA